MSSYLDWVRAFCLSIRTPLKACSGSTICFSGIAGKMFCVANLEPGMSPTKIAFKCTPEKFAELLEIEGIIPAP